MTDIYDENKEIASSREMLSYLRRKYARDAVCSDGRYDIDERTRILRLFTHWPGDDEVRQVIVDVAAVMKEHGIKPEDVKW